MKKRTILQDAQELVDGKRKTDYGDPRESFEKIATVATIIMDKHCPKCKKEITLTVIDVCRILKAVKLIREAYRHKRDNLVDECGYARIESILKGDEKIKPPKKGDGYNISWDEEKKSNTNTPVPKPQTDQPKSTFKKTQ